MDVSPYSLKKIISKIDKVDVVSFDIFDTLIKRNVQKPKDVFIKVQEKYNLQNSDKIYDFSQKRSEAQKNARLNHINDDYTLDELYDFLEYSDPIKMKLKKIEIALEYELCTCNNWMFQIYRYCVKHSKMVICISDMYLSKEDVENLLFSNGYNEVSKIYVSSEHKLRKRTGQLYRKVLSDLEISPKKILHIGDSFKSDFLYAKLNGIRAYHIPTSINNLHYFMDVETHNIDENILLHYLNNTIVSQTCSRKERLGYEIFGPFLYGFIQWLDACFQEKNVEKIFFCSRDMDMVYKIFQKFFPKYNSKYMYISRKSIRGAYLYKYPKLSEINDIISIKSMTMKTFLKNVNVSLDKVDFLLEKYNFTLLSEVNIKEPTDIFSSFADELTELIVNSNKERFELFQEYIKEIEFDGDVALVDSGWNATSQFCLKKVLNDVNIVGYYIGVEQSAYKRVSSNFLNGYLFSENKNLDLIPLVISFKQVLETILSGTQHSVIGYRKLGTIVEPVFDNTNVEMPLFVEDCQKGILNFLNQLFYYNPNLYCNERMLFYGIQQIAVNPSLEDVKILTDFEINNLEFQSYNYPTKNLIYFLLHPKRFVLEFMQAPWKVGYLKALVKFKFPYYKFYLLSKRIKKR